MCGHHNINVTVAAYGVLNGQNYNIFPLVHSLHSFIEWLYETIICSIGQRHFVNRGFLNGPYCPIYGTGALLMILILGHLTNPVALFLLGAIVACVLEYLTSYGMEKLFHARWWDYSKRLLNINGRVCLLGAVVFGLFSVLLILMIHPVICGWVDAVPILYRRVLTVVIFAGFIVDTVSSVSGMVDFQKKLEEHAATVEKRKVITIGRLKDSSAYETIKNRRNILSEKLTRQQLRMIEAFPKLKLHRHNDLLVELRKNISQKRNQR